MKSMSMAPRAHALSVSVFALAGCLTLSSEAVTPLTGDYSINAGGGETGILSVEGNLVGWSDLTVWGNVIAGSDLDVTGDLGVQGMIDFGSALSFPGMAGVTMQYLGTGDRIATFDLTDATGTYLWRDNAGGTVRPKMKLATDNVLSVYNAAGSSATITLSGGTGQINLSGTGSGISANGTAIFTVGGSGDVTWDRPLAVASTTAATSSTTGALTVAGGLGVAKDAYINGLRIGRGGANSISNITIGATALAANVSGTNITAIGSGALNQNTTGTGHTSVGASSLASNTTGSDNTAMGSYASYSNTTGSCNAGLGGSALYGNQTGTYNTGIGYSSLSNNQAGNWNVGLGSDAGRYYAGGGALTTINASTFLGVSTKAAANSDTNTIVIGYGAVGEGSHTTVIGNGLTQSTRLFGKTKTKALEVRGGNTDLNDQVVVEAPVAPATAVRAMRVLADGTVLVKPSGDIPMDGFTTGSQP